MVDKIHEQDCQQPQARDAGHHPYPQARGTFPRQSENACHRRYECKNKEEQLQVVDLDLLESSTVSPQDEEETDIGGKSRLLHMLKAETVWRIANDPFGPLSSLLEQDIAILLHE